MQSLYNVALKIIKITLCCVLFNGRVLWVEDLLFRSTETGLKTRGALGMTGGCKISLDISEVEILR